MRLVDELIAAAVADDRAAGRLAEKQQQNLDRREAYNRLESMLDRMAGDGYLDREELDTLMREFRAQGLDTEQLQRLAEQLETQDGVSRVEVSAEKLFDLRTELADARSSTADDVFFHLEAQELLSDYKNRIEAASKVMKAEHDIYMVAIKHLVA